MLVWVIIGDEIPQKGPEASPCKAVGC